MQTDDIRMMISLGVLNPRTGDELEVLMVWGEVFDDPIVLKRKLALPRDPRYPAMIPAGSARTVVAQMTAEEKVALRDRILAKRAPEQKAEA